MHVAPRTHALSFLFSPIYFATCLAVALYSLVDVDRTPPPKPQQTSTYTDAVVVWTLSTVVDSGVIETATEYVLHTDGVDLVHSKE